MQTCADRDGLLGQAVNIGLTEVLLGVQDGKTGRLVTTLLDLGNLPQGIRAAAAATARPQPR